MLIGRFEKRIDKDCHAVYLFDREKLECITMTFHVHKVEKSDLMPFTEFSLRDNSTDVLRALAEALQLGGYIPQAANDAQLKAMKYHLEDMRNLIFNKNGDPRP